MRDFVMFIDFLLVLVCLLRFGEAYFRVISDLFVASFFASIFDRFGSDSGAILGGFGGAQIDHFWRRNFMDFCVSFQERPKSSQKRPKSGQGRHKSGQEEPKSDQELPWSTPIAAKSGPRAAQSGPRAAKSGSCCRARCRTQNFTSRRHRPLGLYNTQ